MANRLAKQGRTTYVPAVPSQPAVPAYCVVAPAQTKTQTSRPRSSFSSSSQPSAYSTGGQAAQFVGGGYQSSFDTGYYGIPVKPTGGFNELTGQPEVEIAPGVLVPSSSQQSSAPANSDFTAYYEGGQVCYPAQPGVVGSPAQVITDGIDGWNGGARSIEFFSGDGFIQFRLATKPIGVVAGLCSNDATAAFNECSHAIYAHGVTIDIVEFGEVVATAPVSPAANPLITIARRSGIVFYYVDSWGYRSTSPSAGPVYLDAALYSTGDIVDTPLIGALSALPAGNTEHGSGGGDLPALVGIGSEGAYAEGYGALPAITGAGSARAMTAGGGILPALSGYGADRPYAAGYGVLPALTGEGDAGFPQFSISTGSGVIPPLIGVGVMLSGTLASGNAELPALSGYGADRPYAAGAGVLPAMRGYGDDGPIAGTYGAMEFLYFADFVALRPSVFLVVYDGLEFADSASIVVVYDHAAVYDGLLLGETASPSGIIEAMVRDGLSIGDSIDTGREALQYAVNIATGAVTTYQNFDFHGFVRVGVDTYGYRPDGLYHIGDATDNGELLEALLDLGAIDPGTNLKQRLQGAYLGLAADGEAFMRLVGDDGQEWLYQIEQRLESAKAKFGRGLQSREWRVSLHLVDVSSVDLESIEFIVFTAAAARGRK